MRAGKHLLLVYTIRPLSSPVRGMTRAIVEGIILPVKGTGGVRDDRPSHVRVQRRPTLREPDPDGDGVRLTRRQRHQTRWGAHHGGHPQTIARSLGPDAPHPAPADPV